MTSQDIPENLPNNHILAVLGSGENAARAAAKLKQDGFDHTFLFEGESLTETIDAKGEHANAFSKALKAVQGTLSEESDYLAQYEEEARRGNQVIAIEAKDRDRTEQARQVLDLYGARNIRLFGTLAVTDLSPATNPSARAADSPEPQSNA
jgi:hypothetical protein